MNDLTAKLQQVRQRHADVERQLGEPDLVRDQQRYAEVNRQHRDLGEILAAVDDYEQTRSNLAQARQLQHDADPEIAEMARAEAEELEGALETAEQKLWILLLPRDPNDDKNTIIEIRAGTGGEEAALFAGDLFRMYGRYAEARGWRTEILSANESDLQGFKEVIFSIIGDGVYSRMKYEGGGHRVQRVPATEASGRIHTSAVTVAVMPEAEEVDIAISPEEIKIDVFRSSGPGGQSVNTTDSAVRITHLPTGLVVSCQDEKSQHKNKAKALKVLRSRLLDAAIQEQADKQSAARRLQVGSGDRSERVRTYNFPQNRVTDHRIKQSFSLEQVIEGELDPVIEALIVFDQAERLKESA